MLIHWIWFSRLKLSAQQKIQLLQIFHDPEDLYGAPREALEAVEGLQDIPENPDLTSAHRLLESCAEKGIRILTYGDEAYPSRLKNTEDPPMVLYYRGALPDWDAMPAIGTVGTRKASPYGLNTALQLGFQIAQCGGLIVSGGADGIDTQALEGALQAGKQVVAVLGFGADVVYPAKNRDLFDRIRRQGCLLTEYEPGTPAYSWNFPKRNRIISGLSCGVLVVEAPQRSGALNTARYAREQGRDLFVVPGNIDSVTCQGSNALLREQALPVFTGWDIMQEYACLYPHTVRQVLTRQTPVCAVAQQPVYPEPQKAFDKKSIDNPGKSHYSVLENNMADLSGDEQQVLSKLTASPRPVDDVIAEAELPAAKVLSVLTMLTLKGIVVNHPGKRVSLK